MYPGTDWGAQLWCQAGHGALVRRSRQMGNKYVIHHLTAVSTVRTVGFQDDDKVNGNDLPTVLARIRAGKPRRHPATPTQCGARRFRAISLGTTSSEALEEVIHQEVLRISIMPLEWSRALLFKIASRYIHIYISTCQNWALQYAPPRLGPAKL